MTGSHLVCEGAVAEAHQQHQHFHVLCQGRHVTEQSDIISGSLLGQQSAEVPPPSR